MCGDREVEMMMKEEELVMYKFTVLMQASKYEYLPSDQCVQRIVFHPPNRRGE